MLPHAPEDAPHPKTRTAPSVKKQPLNISTLVCASFAGRICRRQQAVVHSRLVIVAHPKAVPIPRNLFSLIACAHPSHPPLAHLVLRGHVRPRLHQDTHHRVMPLGPSDVQRRVASLRRAPPCQHPPLHPTRAWYAPLRFETTFVKKLSRNLTAPRPGALFNFRGRGGVVVAAVVAIRCAHLSQTRPGPSLPLENATSRTGTPLCSHV